MVVNLVNNDGSQERGYDPMRERESANSLQNKRGKDRKKRECTC